MIRFILATALLVPVVARATPTEQYLDQQAVRAAQLPADHRGDLVGSIRKLGSSATDSVLKRLEVETAAMNELRSRAPLAHDAYVAALLDALGSWRVPRAEATFTRFFEAKASPTLVVRMAASGLGRLCKTTVLSAHLIAGDAREGAAAEGLGLCRTQPSADLLIARLEARPSPEAAVGIAKAMGMLGSSWAWGAYGPSRREEGARVRSSLSSALLAARGFYEGAAEQAIITALLMVDDPAAGQVIAGLPEGDALRTHWTRAHAR